MMQTAPSLLRQGPGVLPNVGVNITVVGDPGTATVEVLAAKGFLLHGPSANRRVLSMSHRIRGGFGVGEICKDETRRA